MDSLLLSSNSFEIGSFLFPAFQLRIGECVCLHLPEAITSAEVEALIRVLIGKTSLPEVRPLASVRWAAPVRNRRHGVMDFFRSMRVADWLQRVAGASPTQVQGILQRLSLKERECRIEQLAGTAKTLLSLETAWLAGAQIVVFTTAELDPLGKEAVYQAVDSHFPQGGAIHLSFPFVQNGERRRECFAGTMCLEPMKMQESPDLATTSPRIK